MNPIGAFEQHSCHLPLATDSIEAEYLGRFVAHELDAALLPVLNYGTSLEHAGFSGTVTLRPETLMQFVRDVADAVEKQGFTTMIILNVHGGNHALGPVVRDINRQDRKLKILLTHFAAPPEGDMLESAASGRPDIHAGELETSLMMVLRPELVKGNGPDIRPTVDGFQQADLDTFGMGFIAPEGAYGHPSLASREKGERALESIKADLIRHIRQRLDWLEKNRTYSGRGTDEK